MSIEVSQVLYTLLQLLLELLVDTSCKTLHFWLITEELLSALKAHPCGFLKDF